MHSVFDALEAYYEPDFAEFFMHHYPEIRANKDIRALLPQIQESWGSIQYYRSLNARKYKDLPAWKMSFSDIFRIMAETRFDRREYSDSRYDEAEKLCLRYGYRQKGFENACGILDEMLERKLTSIPDISGKVGAFAYRMLALDDIAAAFFGQMLDCCQMIGGAGKSCMYHSCRSVNGRVFMITDKSGRPVAGSWVWRNGDTVCFDNVEGVRPSVTKVIIQIYKEAAEKLAHSVKGNDAIRKVTFGGGYSEIPTEGFEADDENRFPIEEVSYISDSRKQFILYIDRAVPVKTGQENTPAIYENNDREHMKFEEGMAGNKWGLGFMDIEHHHFRGGYRGPFAGYIGTHGGLFDEFKVGEFAEYMETYFGDMAGVVKAEKDRIRKEKKKVRRMKIKRMLFA